MTFLRILTKTRMKQRVSHLTFRGKSIPQTLSSKWKIDRVMNDSCFLLNISASPSFEIHRSVFYFLGPLCCGGPYAYFWSMIMNGSYVCHFWAEVFTCWLGNLQYLFPFRIIIPFRTIISVPNSESLSPLAPLIRMMELRWKNFSVLSVWDLRSYVLLHIAQHILMEWEWV